MFSFARFVTMVVKLHIFWSISIGRFKLITNAADFTLIIQFRLITGIGVFGRNGFSVCISECDFIPVN